MYVFCDRCFSEGKKLYVYIFAFLQKVLSGLNGTVEQCPESDQKDFPENEDMLDDDEMSEYVLPNRK